jgi:hypothetical protein
MPHRMVNAEEMQRDQRYCGGVGFLQPKFLGRPGMRLLTTNYLSESERLAPVQTIAFFAKTRQVTQRPRSAFSWPVASTMPLKTAVTRRGNPLPLPSRKRASSGLARTGTSAATKGDIAVALVAGSKA